MPTAYVRVCAHLVWATWDRQPSLAPEWEERVYGAIAAKCEELGCPLYAVNGMADHVHVLLRLSATVSVAQVAQHLKGVTSHLINTEFAPPSPFRWQGAYAAFSVGKEEVDRVRAYVRNQKQHHANSATLPEWEQMEA